MCERELETEQNCNILTPTLLAITTFLSRSPGLLNRGPGGPTSLGAGFLYCILSPTLLIPKLSFGGLRAHSAGCWLCLPHLFSNWSDLQIDWISCALSYIMVQRPPSSCGRHNFALILRVHGQGYNFDILRPDAPVIFTGAFPILTARPGRWSIYNTWMNTLVVMSCTISIYMLLIARQVNINRYIFSAYIPEWRNSRITTSLRPKSKSKVAYRF